MAPHDSYQTRHSFARLDGWTDGQKDRHINLMGSCWIRDPIRTRAYGCADRIILEHTPRGACTGYGMILHMMALMIIKASW